MTTIPRGIYFQEVTAKPKNKIRKDYPLKLDGPKPVD